MGREYSGTQAKTISGRTCQRWDSHYPHEHTMTDSDRFPDQDIQAAENYCRNPNGDEKGPWCFTTDTLVPWEYCDIPVCSGKIQTICYIFYSSLNSDTHVSKTQ